MEQTLFFTQRATKIDHVFARLLQMDTLLNGNKKQKHHLD